MAAASTSLTCAGCMWVRVLVCGRVGACACPGEAQLCVKQGLFSTCNILVMLENVGMECWNCNVGIGMEWFFNITRHTTHTHCTQACAGARTFCPPDRPRMLECMENSGSSPKSRQNSSMAAMVSGRVCSPTCTRVRREGQIRVVGCHAQQQDRGAAERIAACTSSGWCESVRSSRAAAGSVWLQRACAWPCLHTAGGTLSCRPQRAPSVAPPTCRPRR